MILQSLQTCSESAWLAQAPAGCRGRHHQWRRSIGQRLQQQTRLVLPQYSRATRRLRNEAKPWLLARLAAGAGGEAQQQQQTFADIMTSVFQQLAQAAATPHQPSGAHLHVCGVRYQPAGTPAPLLDGVNLTLPPNQLGLVFGRSGAGKSTLLQLLAGLAEPTAGNITFDGPPEASSARSVDDSATLQSAEGATSVMSAEQRMANAGLVFQFPERHFIGRTLAEELTVGWPALPEGGEQRQALVVRTHAVLQEAGLAHLPLDMPLTSLSDGFKRRVALAVQLVRRPALLLLDEPLAGLDWRARSELLQVLRPLKRECTVVVVSHDLRELAPLVDAAWEMRVGGTLEQLQDTSALPFL